MYRNFCFFFGSKTRLYLGLTVHEQSKTVLQNFSFSRRYLWKTCVSAVVDYTDTASHNHIVVYYANMVSAYDVQVPRRGWPNLGVKKKLSVILKHFLKLSVRIVIDSGTFFKVLFVSFIFYYFHVQYSSVQVRPYWPDSPHLIFFKYHNTNHDTV